MTRTITVVGARGGQGTTTVATVLAVLTAGHQPTTLVSGDPASTAALLGVPLSLEDEWAQVTQNLRLDPAGPDPFAAVEVDDVVVVDAGRCATARRIDFQEPSTVPVMSSSGECYAVLRGPCYVALATLLTAAEARYDGVILVAEPGRSLTALDITDVLGVPVVATIAATPAVARTIDAGLLLARLHRHREFDPLRSLALDPRQPKSAHPKIDTALLLSRGDRSTTKVACRDRPCRAHLCGSWKRTSAKDKRARYRSAEPRRG